MIQYEVCDPNNHNLVASNNKFKKLNVQEAILLLRSLIDLPLTKPSYDGLFDVDKFGYDGFNMLLITVERHRHPTVVSLWWDEPLTLLDIKFSNGNGWDEITYEPKWLWAKNIFDMGLPPRVTTRRDIKTVVDNVIKAISGWPQIKGSDDESD